MSDASLYLRAAEELRSNEGQWQAYESKNNCVLLAGPGSGKTKTLTTKLARMLHEDVQEPRGLACITYSNECARELESRLDALGIEPGRRVFIGTVHSFSLTQILLPYGQLLDLGLPEDFSVATNQQRRGALEAAFAQTIGGAGNPHDMRFPMDAYRRAFLNRAVPEWHGDKPHMAALAEAYEGELRKAGLVDFEDMPYLALRAVMTHDWLRKALLAKYPILAIDEYQDLGRALHFMVLWLCFKAGMRLLAVGDTDQSLYGFNGAKPELLQKLAARSDVETISLELNYRCGSRIVVASEFALGEARGYKAPVGAHQGTVYFHSRRGDGASQARYLFEDLLPGILARHPGMPLGEVAILYPDKRNGNDLARAAKTAGIMINRSDANALYPRSNRILRWLEQCAIWCCGGWTQGQPRFGKLVAEGIRIFGESIRSEDDRLAFQRQFLAILWDRRDVATDLRAWLSALRVDLIEARMVVARSLTDEIDAVDAFIERLGPSGDIDGMLLSEFAGLGSGQGRINLSTLHSAKGREFDVAVMFAMDDGIIPWRNVSTEKVLESRRAFYVGFTRARQEVHLVFSEYSPSRFVTEVRERLGIA